MKKKLAVMSSKRREMAAKQYLELEAPAAATVILKVSPDSGDSSSSALPAPASPGAASDSTSAPAASGGAAGEVAVGATPALPSADAKDPAYEDAPAHSGLPPRPPYSFSVVLSSKLVLLQSKLNLLLFCIPFAYGFAYGKTGDGVTFFFSLLGMIPLAALLGYLTEEIAKHTSQTIGGLLNATFGNATEMIISIIALKDGLLRIVQVSLLGSVLSNLLLVLGSAFILGGVKDKEQKFNKNMTTTNSGLLMLGVIGLLFPAVLDMSGSNRGGIESELSFSRFTALFLLFLYVAYLVFQLKTHAHLFVEDEDEEEKELTLLEGLIWLAVVTIIISMLSDFLVEAIKGTAESSGIPQIFLGVIFIPIVGNAAEHWTALSAAYKGKMDLALGVAIGSSTQICIFVIPLMVIIGWMMGQPLSLFFQPFETVTLFAAAILCQFVCAEGRSTWLSGLMLVFAYIISAGAFFWHTDTV